MAHVAAFTVSAYSTTAIRTGKPFNPLLGETYECDRTDDKGFRLITEQVSHHPPMLAQYVEQVTFVSASDRYSGDHYSGNDHYRAQNIRKTDHFRGNFARSIY